MGSDADRLPISIRKGVLAGLEGVTGGPVAIASVERVGGGCISPCARLRTDSGGSFFLKWREPGQEIHGLFSREAEALRALQRPGTLRIPDVLGVADSSDTAPGSWLLLEWLESGTARSQTWHELGRGLAGLHAVTSDRYGWEGANFLGPLVQENEWAAYWPAFWRQHRLEPQLRRAVDAGGLTRDDVADFERLYVRLDDLLEAAAEDGPSLLHGDLWSGNVLTLQTGEPALVDPATYYGHREVDIAMTELFGGFGDRFLSAYREVLPLRPAYAQRRAVYQLYYLLVHVVLFGASYLPRTRAALKQALA